MKNTCKILALVLVLMMMFAMASMFTVSAAAPETLYLTPNSDWKSQNARFAAYFFGNGEKWVSMTDSDKDGVYEVTVPAGYPSVIFCRMNPNATANNWNNKWNQTGDLTIPTDGPNHYTIKEGSWDAGSWSTYGSTCAHTNLGPAATCTTPQKCLDCGDPVVSELGHTYNTAHLCTRCNVQATFTVAGSGAHMKGEWAPANTANDMAYADGVYTKVYTNVAAGNYELKCARDHDWGTAYPQNADNSNYKYTVATAGSTVTVTLKGTTVDVKVEAPHTHTWVDATCVSAKYCSTCFATEGEPNPEGHFYAADVCYFCKDIKPSLIVGDNPVVVPEGSLLTVGIVQITDAGTYKVTCADTTVCIFYTPVGSEGSDFTAGTGASWQLYAFEKDLEPGYYYIGIYTPGEYTVTISRYVDPATCEHEYGLATCVAPATCSKCGTTQGEPNPEAHYPLYDTCLSCGKDLPSFKLGDNHIVYVPGSPTLLKGDYYAKIEFTEPGTYVLSGVAPMKGYLWTVPTSKLENGQLTTKTPYAWNVDVTLSENEAECLAPSFEVTITEAGVYWVGFNFDYVGEQREFDINVSLKAEEQPPVDEPTEDPKPEEPKDEAPAAPEMNFFQKIIAWFMDLIQKLLAMFKK